MRILHVSKNLEKVEELTHQFLALLLMDFTDVAIVGGGPAGLTAANTLARQLHTAVVYDNGLVSQCGC
ncbi:thioredoxin reductase glit-like protein [Apiospora phragmitis]|uniref:Thioredoxin reductase glit-like protein n=1 Tax=Apiospora phragmitis TaxID=2905665 RepID=A0ABR1TVX6_9PEZI